MTIVFHNQVPYVWPLPIEQWPVKPNTNIFNSSLPDHMRAHEAYEQALTQAIDKLVAIDEKDHEAVTSLCADTLRDSEMVKVGNGKFKIPDHTPIEVDVEMERVEQYLDDIWLDRSNQGATKFAGGVYRTIYRIVRKEPKSPFAKRETDIPEMNGEAKQSAPESQEGLFQELIVDVQEQSKDDDFSSIPYLMTKYTITRNR